MELLRRKTVASLIWSFSERLLVRGITGLTILILAWYLTPEDFGLIAMITVVISIGVAVVNSGFQEALIRLPDAKPEDFNTAFWANIVLGLFAYLILFFSAPAVATFYDEPRLIQVIQITGLVVIANAFRIVQSAVLSRQLNFRAQFLASFSASLLSAATAVVLAYYGCGVWALVFQMLVSALLITIALWLQGLWRPRWLFSRASFLRLFGFGYKLSVAGLIQIVYRNMYIIVLAKFFAVSVAGLYFFAERAREIAIVNLVNSIQRVTFPALSSIQTDPVRLKASYRKLVSLVAFIFFPFTLLLAALSDPLFSVLPEKWWAASEYFQLICLASVLMPIHAINLNILKVLERSDLVLGLEIVKKGVAVSILFVSFPYGVFGILFGQIVNSVFGYVPNSFFSKKLIGYGVKEQFSDIVPSLLLSSVTSSLVWWFQKTLDWSIMSKVFVLGIFGVSTYLLFAWFFRFKGLYLAIEVIVEFSRSIYPRKRGSPDGKSE